MVGLRTLSKTVRFLAVTIIGVCLAWVLLLLIVYPGRRPTCYLIPAGYIGLVSIDYGVPHAPAAKVENGFLILRIPSTGSMQTSTPFAYGMGDPAEYYYIKGVTRQRLHTESDPYPSNSPPPVPMI
jgi:hypothetical protein